MTKNDRPEGGRTLDETLSEFEWDQALYELMSEGWTRDLADLLKTDRPIPPIVRHYLAALLKGTVKLPDGRGRKNAAMSPKEREAVQAALFKLYSYTETVLAFVEELADERGEEVIELRRYIEEVRREGMNTISEKFKISVNTVRKYHDAKETTAYALCRAGLRDIQTSDGTILENFMGEPAELQAFAIDSARTYLQYPELFFNPLSD